MNAVVEVGDEEPPSLQNGYVLQNRSIITK